MKKILAGCIVSLFIMTAFVSIAAALEFSADMVMSAKGGNFTGKIWVSNDKVRMETAGAATITRVDKKVVWVVMSEQGMYMEQPFDPKNAIAGGAAKNDEIERLDMGADAVDGRHTEKYKVIYRYGGPDSEVYEWVDKELGMPVKVAAVNGSWSVTYKNINARPQDGSLFEIPPGIQKFDMNAMMRSAGAGMGQFNSSQGPDQ